MDMFFDILNLAIGILCVYWAIVGRGYPYKMNFPKKIMKFAVKLMRITLAIAGPMCLGMFAISYFGKNPTTLKLYYPLNIFYWICLGVAVAAIAMFVIVLYSKHGKDIIAFNKTVDKPRNYKN